jgi:hypothetical protein
MSIVKEIKEEINSVQREPTGRDLTILALIFLVFLGLIGSYHAFWKGSPTGYYWIGAGVVLALLRVITPLFKAIYRFWVAFSVVLGYFVSRVLLTIIFYLVITPTGLLMRLCGKDPMERKWDPEATTYWKKREQDPDASIERYEKQF